MCVSIMEFNCTARLFELGMKVGIGRGVPSKINNFEFFVFSLILLFFWLNFIWNPKLNSSIGF